MFLTSVVPLKLEKIILLVYFNDTVFTMINTICVYSKGKFYLTPLSIPLFSDNHLNFIFHCKTLLGLPLLIKKAFLSADLCIWCQKRTNLCIRCQKRTNLTVLPLDYNIYKQRSVCKSKRLICKLKQ